jgi:hypothetical protein
MDAQDINIVIIFIGLFLVFARCIVFSIWGYIQGKKRSIGSTTGMLLGVFLGFIGMIIVYCTNPIDYTQYNNSASRAKADE